MEDTNAAISIGTGTSKQANPMALLDAFQHTSFPTSATTSDVSGGMELDSRTLMFTIHGFYRVGVYTAISRLRGERRGL